MKKTIGIMLAAALLFAACTALAGTLDLTPVKESESLVMQVDEKQNIALITCDKALSVADRHFEHKYEHPKRWSFIASDIIIGDYYGAEPYPVMQTWIYYEGTRAINAYAATFRINGKEYTVTGIGNEARRTG